MNMRKFAQLISVISVWAGKSLDDHEVDQINDLVLDCHPPQPSSNYVSQEAVNELLICLNSENNLIPSIKAYRALTNASLKEAKDAVEKYRRICW